MSDSSTEGGESDVITQLLLLMQNTKCLREVYEECAYVTIAPTEDGAKAFIGELMSVVTVFIKFFVTMMAD